MSQQKKAKTEAKKFQPNRSTPNLSFKPRVQTRGAPSNHGSFNPRSKIICHNCGLPGHIMNEGKQPKVICFGCGKPGHTKPECPNKAAGGGFIKGGGKPGGVGGSSTGGGGNGKNNNGKRGRTF